MKTFIYSLVDPFTKEVRYIGKANNPKARYSAHMSCRDKTNPHKNYWIKGLKESGAKPLLKILEETDDKNWEERERYWIAYGNDSGWNLTNIQAGGICDFSGESQIDPEIITKFISEKLIPVWETLTVDEKSNLTVDSVKSALPYLRDVFIKHEPSRAIACICNYINGYLLKLLDGGNG